MNKKYQKLKQFKTLFSISLFAITVFILLYISYQIELEKEKSFSESISKNYTIYKLFAESDTQKNIYKDSDIIGNIIIPKININYPFFYGINEELLKIAPCRFFGNMPSKKSNLCIAGHNYNDNRFFSKINELENNDLILIEDNLKNQFYYYVYDKFEITEDEIYSIMTVSNNNELTLLTCNNKNNKRIVIKAKTESPN